MIRLGHIDYSNCVPVHALLLESGTPSWLRVQAGVPADLNAALARGEVDVAPCSSIEYARHAADYRLLPEFTIAARGAVHSIRFEARRPFDELHGATIAVPTASATSVVLLRILLARRWGVYPRFIGFEQTQTDPFAQGVDAALWIGDVALRRSVPAAHVATDLGAEWQDWTSLPFAFAVWQVRRDTPAGELEPLRVLLARSRAWFLEHQDALAERYAPRYRLTADQLRHYWDTLVYEFAEDVRAGLLRFYAEAAALQLAPAVHTLSFVPTSD